MLGYWLKFEYVSKSTGVKWWKSVDTAWKSKLKNREGIYILYIGDGSVYIGSSSNVKRRIRMHLSYNSTGMFHVHNALKNSCDSDVWVLVLKIGRLSVKLSEVEKKVYESCLSVYGDRLLNQKSPEVRRCCGRAV